MTAPTPPSVNDSIAQLRAQLYPEAQNGPTVDQLNEQIAEKRKQLTDLDEVYRALRRQINGDIAKLEKQLKDAGGKPKDGGLNLRSLFAGGTHN